MSGPPRRVVVVGRDAALWIAALSVHRALGAAGIIVEAVELPSLLDEADAYTALPSLRGLHGLLGLDDALVVAGCAGAPVAAQRFADWSGPGFLHGYDTQPPPGKDLDFVHYWTKARGEGMRVSFEDFSLAAAAAKQRRIPIADQAGADLRAATGYHLQATNYVAILRRWAERQGIAARVAREVAAEREGERILAVTLDGGARVAGDLFIDASGSQAVLAAGAPGDAFESWRRWLPCDRILAASAPPLRPLPAYSHIAAFEAGWVGLHPLQHRTAVVAAYASEHAMPDLLQKLPFIAGVSISGDAVVTPFEAGMRPRPWIGNCIAVGEAAIRLEPLDAIQLHLVHVGVSQLVGLFPVDSQQFPEAEPYNAAMVRHAHNLRDFQIAHYRLNRRFDARLWDGVRDVEGPATLQAKLDIFAARGETILYDDETFLQSNWASILIGHGIVPRSYDPRVDVLSGEEHIAKVQGRLRAVAEAVRAMPSPDDYVASLMPGPSFYAP